MHHDRFDAFTRRTAVRGLAAALLGGVVAGLPIARRASSVLAGLTPGCEIGAECNAVGGCCDPLVCKIPEGESIGECVEQSDKDKDKNKHKNNNDSNDNQNNNTGGNGGDGIFWPCNIPWFANNPACSGRLGDVLGG